MPPPSLLSAAAMRCALGKSPNSHRLLLLLLPESEVKVQGFFCAGAATMAIENLVPGVEVIKVSLATRVGLVSELMLVVV